MKIMQPLVFVIGFLVVTGAVIFLNTIYTNIFKFDFSPITANVQVNDSTKTEKTVPPSLQTEKNKTEIIDSAAVQNAKIDSLIKKDTVRTIQTVLTSPDKKQIPPELIKNNTPESSFVSAPELIAESTIVDSNYTKWVKATAALYESMDAKKAARIIQNYSEKTARDIIYKMKKKKAAEVLAELDPMVANRIAHYN